MKKLIKNSLISLIIAGTTLIPTESFAARGCFLRRFFGPRICTQNYAQYSQNDYKQSSLEKYISEPKYIHDIFPYIPAFPTPLPTPSFR